MIHQTISCLFTMFALQHLRWVMTLLRKIHVIICVISTTIFIVNRANQNACWIIAISWWVLNSLAPGRCGNHFRNIIFKLIIQNDNLGTCCKISFRWMLQNLSNAKSTLVQVMAWCCQATIHYPSQCHPRFMSPYGIVRPQWVNSMAPSNAIRCLKTWLTLVQVMALSFVQSQVIN